MNMNKIIYLVFILIFFISCDSNERNIKKAFNRLNSRETAAASKYIWPEDQKNLYTFEQRFLSDNELLSLDIETIQKLNNESYKVTLNCNNCNEELVAYFTNKGNLVSETKIEDTIYIKNANGKEYVTFDWDLNEKTISNNIKLSTILTEKLNLRAGPGKRYDVVGQLEKGDELLMDDNYNNSNWRKGIYFEKNSSIKEVYFSSQLTDRKEISFFTLNWADSFGIVVISILGLIVLFVVLLVAVYFTYQIIETAIFELFLINLPF